LPAVDKVLADAVGQGAIPGAVGAVGTSTDPIYLNAVGAAATNPARGMTTDAVFRIASMTKLVTSVAILMLVDEGNVDLDGTLADYVPGFRQPEVLDRFEPDLGVYRTRPALRDATLRELLSHTGGYGYWWLHEPLRLASGEEPNLLDPPFLVADPGQAFNYSTSTDVVGRLIEPVTGLALDVFFEQRIFEPLAMRDTGFRRPSDSSRLVPIQRLSGDGFKPLPAEARDKSPTGGSGLYSTAADYLRLLRCLLRGGELDGTRVVSEAAVAEIGRNQIGALEARMQQTALTDRSNDLIFMDGSQKFGFGVMIATRDRPRRRSAGSYGWGGIVNTFFWVDPFNDIAAVLMLQLAPFACPAAIELLDRFESAVYTEFSPQ
jgi:methyl acetate hydrolase